jgi:hypothetical protein
MINVGQDLDIEAMEVSFQGMMLKRKAGSKIVVFSVSRGGAAAVNWLARYPHEEISAMIIEGSPSHINHLAEYATGISYYWYQMVRSVLPFISPFRVDGQNAHDNISKLPKDLPILLVYSKGDRTVPWDCGLFLNEQMNKHRFTKNKLVLLEKPDHDYYVSDNKEDREIYIDVVREFLSINGLETWERRLKEEKKKKNRWKPLFYLFFSSFLPLALPCLDFHLFIYLLNIHCLFRFFELPSWLVSFESLLPQQRRYSVEKIQKMGITDGYEVIQKIGSGSFGTICKIKRKADGKVFFHITSFFLFCFHFFFFLFSIFQRSKKQKQKQKQKQNKTRTTNNG